jgi:hypothetical protein
MSIVVFSLFISRVKNDYIRIEYAGDTNKPMNVIYISKKPIPRSEQIMTIEYSFLPYNYIVNDEEYLFVKKTVNSTIHKTFEEKDYNGFKITIRENNHLDSCFITRKNSDSLFLKVDAYLKNHKRNKDLISALTKLRTSNVFPENE